MYVQNIYTCGHVCCVEAYVACDFVHVIARMYVYVYIICIYYVRVYYVHT